MFQPLKGVKVIDLTYFVAGPGAARILADWGADVIIGTGPHTLQTMEYLERGDGTEGFVYYSLGNFISAQNRSGSDDSGDDLFITGTAAEMPG